MESFTHLKATLSERIAHIQLNRPDKANALNKTLWHEIKSAFEWADRTEQVRAVILSGAGRSFCAGIDFELIQEILLEVNTLSAGRCEERLQDIIQELQAAFNALEACRKPVLAAVHGHCLGAGLDLVAACDMRYASTEARFALKEVDLGIVADLGSLQRLPHSIGEGQVRELAFTGREVTAAEAKSMGLVNQVFYDPQHLFEGVEAVARTIAAKSPLTIRGIKEVMNYNRDHDVASGLHFVAIRNAAMLLSEDTREAVTAVMETRKPRFDD